MIIYPEGYLIYGNFKDGVLDGIIITDDRIRLKVITYYDGEIAGVGYDYLYAEEKWRMLKYHKVFPI